jgi:hypothetical protein
MSSKNCESEKQQGEERSFSTRSDGAEKTSITSDAFMISQMSGIHHLLQKNRGPDYKIKGGDRGAVFLQDCETLY